MVNREKAHTLDTKHTFRLCAASCRQRTCADKSLQSIGNFGASQDYVSNSREMTNGAWNQPAAVIHALNPANRLRPLKSLPKIDCHSAPRHHGRAKVVAYFQRSVHVIVQHARGNVTPPLVFGLSHVSGGLVVVVVVVAIRVNQMLRVRVHGAALNSQRVSKAIGVIPPPLRRIARFFPHLAILQRQPTNRLQFTAVAQNFSHGGRRKGHAGAPAKLSLVHPTALLF